MRDLIKIDALINENNKSAVSHFADKHRPKLDKIIPVVIVYNNGNGKTKLCARLGFC